MDAHRWRLARELFDRLVDTPEDGWDDRLRRECADLDVREEARAMLLADRNAQASTSVLDSAPAIAAGLGEPPAGAGAPASPLAGQRVGPFRLVRELGRGGMGAVWLAQRADGEFEQEVAIKLIRSDWQAGDMLARFRAERQILAHLQHPNIAHLVDGGVTDDGKPWLALEFVEGTDIVRWCDSARLGIEQRLQLFRSVCAAVSHAHARLVVHRDLKPSNILVGADGCVKLLDFGIAKLLDPEAADPGATRTFTPEYAAPEQVRGDAVTTAVDVHALGLVLHELLCGSRAYRPERPTPAAYERAVLDTEPVRPSVAARESPDGAAAERGTDAVRLERSLRGDLDAIVARALRKEPGERYESVQALSDDIDRHLQNRPVHARRGNRRYRASRFLRRHALAAVFATIAFAALLAGLVATVWQARVARAERDAARASLSFMRNLFDNADPAHRKGEQLSVRDLLDTGARTIRVSLPDQHEAREDMLLTIASAYLGLGQLEQAAPLIDEVLEGAGQRGDHVRHAAALIQECRRLDLGNRSDACPALLDRAEGMLDGADPAQARLIAYSLALRVYGLQLANGYDRIVDDMRRGRALLGTAGDDRFLRVELASHEAFALNRLARPAEAAALLEPIVHELRHDDDAERVLLVDVLGTLSSSLADLDRPDEAIAMQREAVATAEALYGKDDPAIGGTLNTLAGTLSRAGRTDEAIEAMLRTVAVDRKAAVDGKNPELASAVCNLAVLLIKQERYDEARSHLDEAITEARTAEFDEDLGRSLWWRAIVNLATGRTATARADIARMTEVLAPNHDAADEAMLRGRALAFAADLVDHGSAAATASACADAGAIAAAFSRSPHATGTDARFAQQLVALCAQGSPPTAASPPIVAHYMRIAERIRDAWSGDRAATTTQRTRANDSSGQ